jgi:hypothetical protein
MKVRLHLISKAPLSPYKGERAGQMVSEEVDYDLALPQEWLNQFKDDEYDRVMGGSMTAYPKGCLFGQILPITKEAADILLKTVRDAGAEVRMWNGMLKPEYRFEEVTE